MPPGNVITIDEIIQDVSTVHSLPLFYSRLDEAINNPRSSITDIGKIISEDQGLTARILKLANSPLFGYFAKIETISHAVTIIGIQQVRDLALALSVMDVFTGIPKELINMEQFWRHSIATGLTAKLIATSQRESNLERFFVAGILHDVGRLIMLIKIPELYVEMFEECRSKGRLLHEVERERLLFDHAEVGGQLLRKWKIPPSVAEPVEFHHRPQRAEHYPRETSLLHLADIFAHALQIGNSGGGFVPQLDARVWAGLNLSPFLFSSLIKQIDKTVSETEQALFGGMARV
jgi:putative nucleotidyltransferase with HDIG domain